MQIWAYNPDQTIAPVILCQEGERRSQFPLHSHRFSRDFMSDFGWLEVEISLPNQQVFGERDGEIRTMGVTLRGIQRKEFSGSMWRFWLRLYVEVDSSQTVVKYKVY